MATTLDYSQQRPNERTFLGHPVGLFLLFIVEMWERFSFYGMRGFLVLYLVHEANTNNPGRAWNKQDADGLYGWYTGMCYLLPILGGFIADKLIGTHRSMVVGSVVIALGHLVLAVSGIGALGQSDAGMSIFIMGLVLIVLGTGHFKPNVSVMVNKLYPEGDPRRDGAFTIFYMGINVGAFIGPLLCGFLAEKIGWHWGFGCAAVGMILGLAVYLFARPTYLPGIGLAPAGKPNYAPLFGIGSVMVAASIALMYHYHILAAMGTSFDKFVALNPPVILTAFALAVTGLAVWFVASQDRIDRGPTIVILIFVLFNAVFWLAFEQAGSSLNHFADEMTNLSLFGWQMPASWFQSVGALMVVLLAPVFAALWVALGRRNRNPGQPMKLALGLFLVGGGYLFMVFGSYGVPEKSHSASMFWLVSIYLVHTLGELCVSPTGLSFLTKVAPVRSVSLLMGIWFLSNSLANKLGGTIAGQVERVAKGEIKMPWKPLGGQADFYLALVLLPVASGVVALCLVPLLNRLLRRPESQAIDSNSGSKLREVPIEP